MPMRVSVFTHSTPIPTFPLKGGRSDVCRLQADHGVTRAFEALTESAPGFAGGQLTDYCFTGAGSVSYEPVEPQSADGSDKLVEVRWLADAAAGAEAIAVDEALLLLLGVGLRILDDQDAQWGGRASGYPLTSGSDLPG